MTATQNIFVMARKAAQSVAMTTVKLSDNAITKIVVSLSGCVCMGIRCVTRLADMNNYLSRRVPCGLPSGNSNADI